MGIKYYELKVKKLVNFAGVEYALKSDVALKLDESAFNIFKNNVNVLGTAASKNYEVYSGKNLGSFESWELAESGIAELTEGDVVYVNGVGYICTDTTAETFQYRFLALDSCVTSLKDFIALSSEVDGKLDPEDVIAGDNIEISYNEDGTITITGSADPYVLPPAEEDVLGGIKLGDGLEKVYDDAEGTVYTGKVEAVAKTKGDISVSKAIGYLKIGDTISAGTTLDDFLAQLLQTYVTPAIQSVSVAVDSPKTNPAEIGETVSVSKISYSFDGSYAAYKKYLTMGSVKFYKGNNTSGTEITGDGDVSANGEDVVPNSGNLTLKEGSKIELVKGLTDFGNSSSASQSFCVSCGYTKEDGSAGTITKTGSVTWQYAYFQGVLKTDAIPTGNTIRSVLTKKLNPAINTNFTLTAINGDKIVCFAYPKTVHGVDKDQTASSILALDSMSSEVKTAFTYVDITVTLENGEEVAYTLAYLMPDGGFTQQARYKIYI